MKNSKLVCLVVAVVSLLSPFEVRAVGLIASDGASGDWFGVSTSVSGNFALVGALYDDITFTDQGSAYLFRNIDVLTPGNYTQHAKLTASDGAAADQFGWAVGISGATAVVTAPTADVPGQTDAGAAYIFRNLNVASGTITQNAKLIASDAQAHDLFGWAAGISGTIALVTAAYDDTPVADAGSGYVFRNVDTATGTVTQNVKLIASDAGAGDLLGYSGGISGSIAVLGAPYHDFGASNRGAAYIYRNLNTATGTVTENAKLVASDGVAGDLLGWSSSISGSTALVGAMRATIGGNVAQGAAYVYRNVNTAAGTVTENLKIIASDGKPFDWFGYSVALSGNVGIIGSVYNDSEFTDSGAAYLALGLDSGTGVRVANVKIIPSARATADYFGYAVGIDGDNFIIGTPRFNSQTGKVYTGSVSALTTLDAGNSIRYIDQISFNTIDDWIIGNTTDNNQVHLLAGNVAEVNNTGKAVRIGATATSDINRLYIWGTLSAQNVFVGTNGNFDNRLIVSGTVNAPVTVAPTSMLTGSGVVNGTVTLQSNAIIAPFNHTTLSQASNLTTGSLTFNPQSVYSLHLLTDGGTGSAGTHWDRISVNGTLNLSALTSSNPAVVWLRTLSNSTTEGPLASWNPNTYHVWQNVITTTGGIVGFSADKFIYDTSLFANTINSSYAFRFRQIGNNIDLEYYFVPEASTVLPALLALAGAGLLARRRVARRSAPRTSVEPEPKGT